MRLHIPISLLEELWGQLQDMGFTRLRSLVKVPINRRPDNDRCYMECNFGDAVCELDVDPGGRKWDVNNYCPMVWATPAETESSSHRLITWYFNDGKMTERDVNLGYLLVDDSGY